jgi:hypothetical protein
MQENTWPRKGKTGSTKPKGLSNSEPKRRRPTPRRPPSNIRPRFAPPTHRLDQEPWRSLSQGWAPRLRRTASTAVSTWRRDGSGCLGPR